MHYYKKNIGDYAKKAGRLSMLQHGAYTLLIDSCYDRERFPTLEEALEWTWASTTEETEAVTFVLKKFFDLENGVYVQNRIREEIEQYHLNSATNARIASEREAKRKENSTKRAQVVNEPPPNHKPITINQEPDKPIEPDGSVNSEAIAPELDLQGGTEDRKVTPKSGEPITAMHCPVGTIVNLYHEHMPENPRIRVLDDARKKTIAARWRQAAKLDCKPFGYTTGAEGLAAWASFFKVCAQSDFLTGKAKAQPGKPPFMADIDFLMSPSGFKSCLENKYHREVAA